MPFVAFNRFKLLLILLQLLAGLTVHSAYSAVSAEVQAVFANNTCLNCHAGGNPSGGLGLDDATISDNEMRDIVANCSNNNSKLVDPGNPEASVLYIKLASQNPNCGNVMPPSGNLISTTDLNTIYDWIISIGPAAQFGLFVMNNTAVTVNETDTNVTLTVNRQLGTQGTSTVDFTVSTVIPDTATSPTDFIAQSGTLTFADGETTKTITVVLADDTVFEGTEVFSVTLSNPSGGAVLGAAVQTKVSITDNEFDNQPGTFFFSRTASNVAEDAGTLDITILRSFGAAGQVSIDIASADFSANAGTDYQAVSQTVVFEEGERNQSVSITILDDAIEEQAESFRLTLSNPANGALLGSINRLTVTVTIDDNDAPTGGGSGGGTGGSGTGGSGTGGTGSTTPEEEVEFVAAGSLFYLFSMLCAFAWLRKR